ncbi:sulfotransferase [Oscillatoriales cyanobacterium LEGE 11467]|uniref:Sulfotransferase n=1 Tax=Zarconia navalis LEGE 11467 TaxID=1828826 RepID=A0A928Z9I7_9CYAN|nr:sulfotransferase [Zarconia navalis]MBE9041723.1 sulfotransferase [Zarconia navalis LEGE 11467]
MINPMFDRLSRSLKPLFSRGRSAYPPNSQIIWMGCSPRSGSTLLTRILNSHSQIASPCELAIPKYFPTGDVKQESVGNKYQQICDYYQADFERSSIDPKYLMARILEREGKECIVLKDPRQSLFLAEIARDFPDSKFIHLVRDVRSVAMSKMFANRPKDAFERWLEYNQAVLNVTKTLNADRVFSIRYENIIEKPREAIEKLVRFLGYDFEPSMLDYGQFDHADEKMRLWDGTTPSYSPLHTALETAKISQDVAFDRQNYTAEILALYQSDETVRDLNIFLNKNN